MVNCIIGSGIFGLPSVISGVVGNASPFAWLFAAAATGLVMACFAEVSSRFDQSGGVYLYTRTAFGRTTGIAVAWLGWLTRLGALAANANLFVIYLAEFWPAAEHPSRATVLTVLLGFLTVVNYSGVRSGTRAISSPPPSYHAGRFHRRRICFPDVETSPAGSGVSRGKPPGLATRRPAADVCLRRL